jgi:CRISPR type I-E-associated protein CasB/Cse2
MNNANGTGGFITETDVARLAGAVRALRDYRPGDQADLRRMVPAAPPLVFYQLLLEHIPDDWNGAKPGQAWKERAWVAILQGMALLALSGKQVHDAELSLGTALGRTFSANGQSRFWRLLQARDETFYDLLRHLVRMLAHEGIAVNWTDIARLCLSPEERREECRRRLARDFCRARQEQPRNVLPEQPGEEQGAAS